MFLNLVQRNVTFLQVQNLGQVSDELRVRFSVCRGRCDGDAHRLRRDICKRRRDVGREGEVHTSFTQVEVHTSFTQVEVQILVFKSTLVKEVEVLTKLLYSSQSKEGFEMYFSKKYPYLAAVLKST